MDNIQAQIKKIGDMYLDLGVAIAELKQLARVSPRANTGLQGKIEKIFESRPESIINMHQLAAELKEPAEAIGKATQRLASKGILLRLGSGTYIKAALKGGE